MKHWSKAANVLSGRFQERKLRNERNMIKHSSQKGTQIEKIGASPFKSDSLVGWGVGVLVGFVISGGCIKSASLLNFAPWLQLFIGVYSWLLVTWWVHSVYLQFRKGIAAQEYNEVLQRLVSDYMSENQDLKAEVRLLKRTSLETGLNDFVTGMNQAGVEIALGGADPFGQTAQAKLFFPVTILHKHIVSGFMEGWEEGKREAGGMVTSLHESQYRERAERQAWMWIQEMTEGKR